VQFILKKLFSLILLFCFTTTIFHFHSHDSHEKISKQIIDQQNDVGHHFSNECEKCLSKNQKSELIFTSIDFFNFFPILSKNKSVNFTNCYIYFNKYSRPPPSSLS